MPNFKADLSNIELAEGYNISVDTLQEISSALQKAADSALLATETATDPEQWQRLSLATLTSTINRAAVESIMRCPHLEPKVLKDILIAAKSVNDAQIRSCNNNALSAEIQTSGEDSLKASFALEKAITIL